MSSGAAASERTPAALTIAGSDSGGGAGIQADLKALAALGVHGTAAITAITAQNTLGVTAIHAIPPTIVLAQVRAVLDDIRIDAVKVGMLGDVAVIDAVAQALAELPDGVPVVVDPVMVAESGARLLESGAERALVERIVSRASVLTPNVPEALALVGRIGDRQELDEDGALALAEEVLALGAGAVLLTGGHRREATDVLVSRGGLRETIGGPRHRDGAAHGSGCTHSALLAGALARGADLPSAARTARELSGEAVGRGLRDIGAGAGPVDVIDLQARRREAHHAVDRLS